MSRYSDNDPYLDPASGVLRNRLGIADEAILEQTEAAFVAIRSYELSQTPLKGLSISRTCRRFIVIFSVTFTNGPGSCETSTSARAREISEIMLKLRGVMDADDLKSLLFRHAEDYRAAVVRVRER